MAQKYNCGKFKTRTEGALEETNSNHVAHSKRWTAP